MLSDEMARVFKDLDWLVLHNLATFACGCCERYFGTWVDTFQLVRCQACFNMCPVNGPCTVKIVAAVADLVARQ